MDSHFFAWRGQVLLYFHVVRLFLICFSESSYHSMERPQVAEGGRASNISSVAATILNKRKARKGGTPTWDWARC